MKILRVEKNSEREKQSMFRNFKSNLWKFRNFKSNLQKFHKSPFTLWTTWETISLVSLSCKWVAEISQLKIAVQILIGVWIPKVTY